MGCRMVSPVCTTRNMGGFIPERVGGLQRIHVFHMRGNAEGQRAWGRRTGKALKGILKEGTEEVAGGRGCRKWPGLTRGVPAIGVRNGRKRSSPSSCYGMNLQV